MNYRVCTSCEVHHYENCPDCFGFGLAVNGATGKTMPALASEAHGEARLPPLYTYAPCPTCKSTIYGVPTEEVPA